MNITNTIWRNCNAHPDRIAILYKGHPVTYGTLRVAVERASARLAAAGVARGDVVALSIYKNNLSHLIVLLAVARLGAIAMPLDRYKKELVEENRIHSIVLEKDDGWRSGNLPALRYLEARMLLASPVDGERLDVPLVAQDLDEQPWLIAHTSGTTGRPKKNPHTHARGALIASLTRRAWEDEERVFLFGSPGVEYGINIIMRQLYYGGTIVLTQSTKPEEFLAVVQRDRPTRVVTTTGNASPLVAHAAKALPESLAICASIKSISISGSFVSPALRVGIERRICSRVEVGYGSTETSVLARSTPETRAARPNSVGRLVNWVQAEAVDENDQPLPYGQRGILRFKSPTLATGYLDDEEATARAFRNGWFYPGDTGSVGAAGYLFLSGRIDEVINLGGEKIDPRLIEELLDEQPEIIASAAVALKQETGIPVLVAAVEALGPFDSEALKGLCRQRLGRTYVPHAIVQIDALPRNETGKVIRSALAVRLKISSGTQRP